MRSVKILSLALILTLSSTIFSGCKREEIMVTTLAVGITEVAFAGLNFVFPDGLDEFKNWLAEKFRAKPTSQTIEPTYPPQEIELEKSTISDSGATFRIDDSNSDFLLSGNNNTIHFEGINNSVKITGNGNKIYGNNNSFTIQGNNNTIWGLHNSFLKDTGKNNQNLKN